MLYEKKQTFFDSLFGKRYEIACDCCEDKIEDFGVYVFNHGGVLKVHLGSSSSFFSVCKNCTQKDLSKIDIEDLSSFHHDCSICKIKQNLNLENFNNNVGFICRTCIKQKGNKRNRHEFLSRKPSTYTNCNNCKAIEVNVKGKFLYWKIGLKKPLTSPPDSCEDERTIYKCVPKCDYIDLNTFPANNNFSQTQLEIINHKEMYTFDLEIIRKGFTLQYCTKCGHTHKDIIW